MPSFSPGALLILSLGFAVTSSSALSAPSTKTHVEALITGWRAAGATVTVAATTAASNDSSVSLRDLRIALPASAGLPPGATLAFDALDLTGLTPTADGWHVDAAKTSAARVTLAGYTVSLADGRLEGLDLPTHGWPNDDAKRPAGSLVALLKALGRVGVQQASAAQIAVKADGAATDALEFTQAALGPLANGRLAEARVARIRAGNGTVDVQAATLKAVELTTVQRIFDSATYNPVPPERLWTAFIGEASVGAAAFSTADRSLRFASARINNAQLRPFGSDVGAKIDAAATAQTPLTADTEAGRSVGLELTDSLLLQSAAVDGLSLTTTTDAVRQFECATLVVGNISPRAIKDGEATRCALTNASQTQIRLGRMALQNLSAEALITSAATATAKDVAPTLNQLSLSDVAITQGDTAIGLAKLDLAMADHIRGIPARVDWRAEKLTIPLSAIPDEKLRTALTGFGLSTLSLDFAAKAGWREASREFEAEQVAISIAQLGRLSASASLTGIPRSVFDSAGGAVMGFAGSGLKRIKITYEDASLAQKLLEQAAAANKLPPEEMRKNLSRLIPNMLGLVADASARGKLTFALLSFVNAPGTLELSSGLVEPVPMAKVVETAQQTLPLLPGLLKLNATATKPTPGKSG